MERRSPRAPRKNYCYLDTNADYRAYYLPEPQLAQIHLLRKMSMFGKRVFCLVLGIWLSFCGLCTAALISTENHGFELPDTENTDTNWQTEGTGVPLSGPETDAYILAWLGLERVHLYFVAFAPIVNATEPTPNDKETDVSVDIVLTWRPGRFVARHNVYFGTSFADVSAATTINHTNVQTSLNQDANTYAPIGPLTLGRTYYWRVDEVNDAATDAIWQGDVWSFTTLGYVTVDDFEDYNDFSPYAIFQTWIDGHGFLEPAPGKTGNGSGSIVGHLEPPFAEQAIIHGGGQSMPMDYNNTEDPYFSEVERTWPTPQDWTIFNVKALTLWFRGLPASVGSFEAGPNDTFVMAAAGADIGELTHAGETSFHDEFHYAFMNLNGDGSMQLKVDSVEDTNEWAKAGIMIRETLDANSPYTMAVVTPGNGVAFQYRTTLGGAVSSIQQAGISVPRWLKITRSGNTITAEHSDDGNIWVAVGTGASADIAMKADVYIGIALTAHNPTATCHATFSNVFVSSSVTGQWQSQDIGIIGNDAEPLYVIVEDDTGNNGIVTHPDPNAVLQNIWQEWNIPLAAFSDAGVDIENIKKMYIGAGNRESPKQGGKGNLYFDDIRLYPARCVPSLAGPAADIWRLCGRLP
jgi:hypothetical protein